MAQEHGMNLQETIAIFKKDWRFIVLVTVLATIVTAALNYGVIPPTYEAATSVIVGQGNRPDQEQLQYDAIMMYQRLTRTYMEIARSKRVLSETAKLMGGKFSERELEKRVNATTLEGTQILILKARSRRQKEAFALANALTRSFIGESQRVYPFAKIQILDQAEMPKKPVQPHSLINTITALLLGFIAALGMTLARETLCDTFRTPQDVERESQIPVLGAIPRASRQQHLKERELVVQKYPASAMSEAYRILRTRLFCTVTAQPDQPLKTLLVTSALPGEGRTSVAGNLALVIAQTGKNVLLLDGDLRKTRPGKVSGRFDDKGLSHLLTGKYGNVAMKQLAVNLYSFPAGFSPNNPTELLLSPTMKDFVVKSREAFDYILIDSPALSGTADAQILATMADGVLLVIGAGESRMEAVQKAKKDLLSVQANLIGAVFNKSKAG
jgi:capsular exopolysaccharide synthesis family protein